MRVCRRGATRPLAIYLTSFLPVAIAVAVAVAVGPLAGPNP